MRNITLLLLLGVVVAISGCSSGEASTADAGTSPVTGRMKDGTRTSGAPPKSIPEGGIVMQPSDPNNPVYKADPNLHGGG
jgi:hypothetical protein